jgi:hypothetical protein
MYEPMVESGWNLAVGRTSFTSRGRQHPYFRLTREHSLPYAVSIPYSRSVISNGGAHVHVIVLLLLQHKRSRLQDFIL